MRVNSDFVKNLFNEFCNKSKSSSLTCNGRGFITTIADKRKSIESDLSYENILGFLITPKYKEYNYDEIYIEPSVSFFNTLSNAFNNPFFLNLYKHTYDVIPSWNTRYDDFVSKFGKYYTEKTPIELIPEITYSTTCQLLDFYDHFKIVKNHLKNKDQKIDLPFFRIKMIVYLAWYEIQLNILLHQTYMFITSFNFNPSSLYRFIKFISTKRLNIQFIYNNKYKSNQQNINYKEDLTNPFAKVSNY